MRDFRSTAVEIQKKACDTVIVPIGSTEQHGPHLPIYTDVKIGEAIARGVAEVLDADMIPALPISTCKEHKGRKGSVWMSPDTFYKMIMDIVLCLKSQGYKRIILIQSHGGIFVLGPVVREINSTIPDIRVIKVDYTNLDTSDILECTNELHAGEYETSLMLYLDEESVHMDKAVDSDPKQPRDFLNYGNVFNMSEYGVWGKATLATKEKGEKLFAKIIDCCVDYIKDVDNFIDNLKEKWEE